MNTNTLSGLSLRDLEYVQAIAREGHFARAASLCGVSQPAISQQIQKLEARLGFAIFERQGKRITVTEAGRFFVGKTHVILSEARELLELASGLTYPMRGEFRIGVIPTLGSYLLPLILKPIKNTYPEMKLIFIEEPTTILENMLSERELDVAVTATEPNSNGFSTAQLFFEPYIYTCPTEFGLQPNEPIKWAQIDKTQLLLLSEEHCLREQTIAMCDLIIQPGQRVASSLEMLRQLVAIGDGSALLPALSVSGADRFNELVTLHPIIGGKFGRNISLIWRKTDPRSEHLNQFGKLLNELMKMKQM